MKKIMFNDRLGLTQAVLEGRKTMTRRAICVPERWHGIEVYGFSHIKGETALQLLDGDDFCIEDTRTGQMGQILPTYKIGEVVAVAQSYEAAGISFISPPDPQWGCTRDMHGYSNKMFVRADLMPHQIQITGCHVERLQDISDDECLKEGIEICYYGNKEWYKAFNTKDGWKAAPTPREAFAALIDKMSGKGTWESNPWVFVYGFELVK